MGDFSFYIYQGDCLDVMKKAPDNYFDSMVTDPPSGTGFMNRDWDKDKGGRNAWVAWMAEVMKEALRALKPGGHALVWALPRTSHWTATALEDAGFEVRDVFTHHFGSGFPKSQDVSTFIDKLAGANREVVGKRIQRFGLSQQAGWNENSLSRTNAEIVETAPSTDDAKQWAGWGTGIKPGSEHWILVRKPLSEKSVARNVLRWGTGALNIDACRVNRASDDVPGWHKTGSYGRTGGYSADKCPDCVGGVACETCKGTGWINGTFVIRDMPPEEVQARCGNKGRWPPNLLLSHGEGCQLVGTEAMPGDPKPAGRGSGGIWTRGDGVPCGPEYGGETVEVWDCQPDCPVAEINRQSGTSKAGSGKFIRKKSLGDTEAGWGMRHDADAGQGYGDSGGASRFFPTFKYQAKPARREREAGLDEMEESTLNRVNPGGLENEPRFAPIQVKNNHPTCKGVNLMIWLTELVTPPGGLVLDPFAGSGTTGVACLQKGFRFVGIEQDEHFAEIARARIAHALEETNE
jgi:DNA modification methylase